MATVQVDSEALRDVQKTQQEELIANSKLPVKPFDLQIAKRALLTEYPISFIKRTLDKTEFDIYNIVSNFGFFTDKDSKTFTTKFKELCKKANCNKQEFEELIEKNVSMNSTLMLDRVFLALNLISTNAYLKVHADYVIKAKREVEDSMQRELTNSINQNILNFIK